MHYCLIKLLWALVFLWAVVLCGLNDCIQYRHLGSVFALACWHALTSAPDPVNGALHPPRQDPVPEAADPVPVGGILQLCGEDSTNHTGGMLTYSCRQKRKHVSITFSNKMFAIFQPCSSQVLCVLPYKSSHCVAVNREGSCSRRDLENQEGWYILLTSAVMFLGRFLAVVWLSIMSVICSCQSPFICILPAEYQAITLLLG